MRRISARAAYAVALSVCLGCVIGCGGSGSSGPPPPTITSFVASPATITLGGSATLTGVFSNGTGVITPGNLSATSGTAVSVSPAANTTYTLTVTPSSGAAITQTAIVTVNPAPTISSFGATPGTINAGGSSSLLGVFAGGTGVITPGNLPATSGTAVSVSPTTTTTYTLTVTPPAGGTAPTLAVTVTVNPAQPPTITSFIAGPPTISVGGSTGLTAVFANGTGVITPGNFTATSGTAVSVSPTTTTIYTLTVTPPTGTAITQALTVFIQSSVTVDPSSAGLAVTDQLLGLNMAVWNDTTLAQDLPSFQAAGIKAVRWPGGSTSDVYHWQGTANTPASPSLCDNGYANPNDTFSDFVNEFAVPGGLDIALTADYGSNPACTGGGDPTEAAAWVANALTLGVTVSHMTVGNEEYGHWEYDLHAKTNDPTTYAAATAGSSGYYALIKAASPNTLVGVEVDAGAPAEDDVTAGWDPIVLAGAPYDFVEYHYYPQNPGGENDTYLVQSAAQGLTTGINTIKSELATAGKPNTPIYVGEMGSVSSNPGPQSWSITQGLYAGQLLGEMMNDGVVRATWWIGFGNCNGTGGYDGTAQNPIYSWQTFGAYNIFSDGPVDTSCPGAGPLGTMSPTAVAYQMFSNVAVSGESVLTPGVAGDTNNVRAYAATNKGGTALVLFNLNENSNAPVTITLTGISSATTVTVETYDKSLYDMSNPANTNPIWAPPVTTSMGAQSLPLTLTLAPWSMNVVLIH